MNKRSDILDGRQRHLKDGLIYTDVLGRIDLRHAQGMDIRNLRRKIGTGETNITKLSIHGSWLTRPDAYSEHKSIALATMMSLARKFKGLQSSFPVSLTTDS